MKKGRRVVDEFLISLVEDDLSLQNALVRLVRSLGYSARGFSSAEEFLESDVLPTCACVITDIQMPGMSGIDLSNRIAEQPSPIPVIMITAQGGTDLERSALASGALCFLRKPIDTKRLIDCIERALRLQPRTV